MAHLSCIIDTQIFDKIVDEPGVLALVQRLTEAGELEIRATSAQRRELAEVGGDRGDRLRSVPATFVGTVGFVLDHSQVGIDRLGPAEPIQTVRPGTGKKHLEDALTASTALFENRALVTEDGRLRRRAEEVGIEVWPWHDFFAQLRALDARSQTPARR